jgi:spermidine synthase
VAPPVVDSTAPRRLPDALAATAVFIAAAAVLVLEIVGLRVVGPYVGVTLQTSSAVIGVSLAAIAYGAWTGGRLADRVDPRRLLPPTFLLAAAATAVTLPVVRWTGEPLRGSSAGSILTLAALAVFAPAALLSSITPIVVKLQLSDVAHTGRVVGKLSGIGTLGGITATLGTGFVLVAALPSSAILLSLAVLLALLGLGLYVYLRRLSFNVTRGAVTMVAVAGLSGAGLTVVAPTPCDVETAYHCARVQADPNRPGGRLLLLNGSRHSYEDLDNPRWLEFAYAQWIGAFLDELAPRGAPLRGLHVGGGGFTLPRYVAASRPGSYNRVLELDGALVELDRQKLGLTTGPDLDVVVGDARINLLAQDSGAFDVVVGDAFGHLAVPWHLTTREFVADIRRVLRPGGAYALNVIDYPPGRLIRAELATVMAVFAHVAVVAPSGALDNEHGANFVVLASDAPLPLDALRPQLQAQDVLTQRADPTIVLDGQSLVDYVGDSMILTDDHAPVDQLLTRP